MIFANASDTFSLRSTPGANFDTLASTQQLAQLATTRNGQAGKSFRVNGVKVTVTAEEIKNLNVLN